MSTLSIPRLRFTVQQAESAYDQFRFNCGPSSIAAILGLSIEELRPHLGDFEKKGYTNPTLMWEILKNLGVHWRSAERVPGGNSWPNYGLARIQWEGPWTGPKVPPRAAYRYTHWVGACRESQKNIGIWDVNALSEYNDTGWVSLKDWEGIVVPYILKQYPRADGKWHITHSVEVIR